MGYRKAVKVKKIVPDETRSYKKREGALFDTFFFFEKFPDDNLKVSKQSSPKNLLNNLPDPILSTFDSEKYSNNDFSFFSLRIR